MTYQEIVNRIQALANRHKMIADFGYGDLSDLKTRFENTSGDQSVQADYPYLFLNPAQHTRNQNSITYNFNMIIMDMARGEVDDQPYNNMLAIQSQCQQYIDDILAYLYNGYQDGTDLIYSNVTYQPFNERFQDDVAGMTASLQITLKSGLDNCITPFEPLPVPCLSELTVFSNSTNNFPYTLDADAGSFWRWETNTLETPAIGQFNDQFFSNAVNGDFEFYITSNVTFIEPVVGEALPQPPVLTSLQGSFPDTPITCDSGNWPTLWSAENSTISYTAKYNITLDQLTNFGIVQFLDQPGNESAIIQQAGGTLTIGYASPPPELVLTVQSTIDQSFRPDLEQSPLRFQNIILDSQGPFEAPTYTGWRNPGFNFYTPSTAGTWRFVLTGEVTLDTDQGDWPNSPDIILRLDGTLPQTAPTTTTWPATQPVVGVATPFECVWEGFSYIPDEPGNPNDDYLMWNWINEPQIEDEFTILTGATLTGTFTPAV